MKSPSTGCETCSVRHRSTNKFDKQFTSGGWDFPKDNRNVDELERQIRRLMDRALLDVREDFDEFFSDKG